MYDKLKKAIHGKFDKDIVIIGKGPSIDDIDLKLINDCIIINTNDSELIVPGDVAVFHHGWVLDIFDTAPPRCKLYISDKLIPGSVDQIHPQFVSYTPDSSDFLLKRFFSDTIYIENSIIVTALRVAEEIARQGGYLKKVYLLGFDFSTKEGYTRKIATAASHADSSFSERVVSSQEHLLQMILAEKSRLLINVLHVGVKPYSVYSVQAFNKIFSRRGGLTSILTSNLEAKVVPKVKVVAEITTNHFGDMDRLRSMILAAHEAGADYIKLQKRDVESFYSEEELLTPYASPFGNTFRDYRCGIELSMEQFSMVDDFCKNIGIGWFVSVLDLSSYEFIKNFNPEIIKLPSTISEHKDYLAVVASDFKNDVVISTGFTDSDYENYIFNTFVNSRNIYLLQCTSTYPAKIEEAQIGVVRHYYNLSKFQPKLIPGFSSHDIGSICSMLAVAAGACMIEKHVKFGDVSWSHFDEVAVDLVNGDFDRFVSDIRKAEEIVGEERKMIQASEHHKYWRKENK
jgi:sialic acid synthase SpsE